MRDREFPQIASCDNALLPQLCKINDNSTTVGAPPYWPSLGFCNPLDWRNFCHLSHNYYFVSNNRSFTSRGIFRHFRRIWLGHWPLHRKRFWYKKIRPIRTHTGAPNSRPFVDVVPWITVRSQSLLQSATVTWPSMRPVRHFFWSTTGTGFFQYRRIKDDLIGT